MKYQFNAEMSGQLHWKAWKKNNKKKHPHTYTHIRKMHCELFTAENLSKWFEIHCKVLCRNLPKKLMLLFWIEWGHMPLDFAQ